ncbi:Stf0 family sulfotransferase [Kineococcus gypseus]|uniref:Stf0 family sulfotransferase n=1 Tax=Kineococcus gypseus TaxID=1637102 RepID=UPI003D7F12FC
MPPALRPYLVCASQRSGSTVLCETLRSTGVAGNPLEHFEFLRTSGRPPQPREWFAGVDDPGLLALLAPLEQGSPPSEGPVEWRSRVLAEGRTPNGVWGGKLMWNQVGELLARLEGLPGRSGTDLRSAVADLLGEEPVYVHVHRPDVVAQAVSMWRAVQTQRWRDDGAPAGDDGAVYHADGIAHLEAVLLEQERSWRRWFEDEGIEPVRIGFDDLKADVRAAAARVLEAVGLPGVPVSPPTMRRQGDGRSKQWAERYRSERAGAGGAA